MCKLKGLDRENTVVYCIHENTSLNTMTCKHGGAVVTHSSPTSEVGGSNPGPYVGKFVVAYRWSAVCSTNFIYWFPLPTKLTFPDITYSVLKVM